MQNGFLSRRGEWNSQKKLVLQVGSCPIIRFITASTLFRQPQCRRVAEIRIPQRGLIRYPIRNGKLTQCWKTALPQFQAFVVTRADFKAAFELHPSHTLSSREELYDGKYHVFKLSMFHAQTIPARWHVSMKFLYNNFRVLLTITVPVLGGYFRQDNGINILLN